MTASVSGFSILQGFASALDTLLPSAWTSSNPQLVGLWSQRMSRFFHPVCLVYIISYSPLHSCGHVRVINRMSRLFRYSRYSI